MSDEDPLIGYQTDSLVFEQLLGKGAMGAVYKGTQVRLNRPVAIKVIAQHLAEDPSYVDRFNREAQTLGRLSHPHVIACHDFGPTAGPNGDLLVMVLEFVDGWSLGALAKEKRLTVRQVVELHRQAAEGLAAAKGLNIVHRDIKPDNLMVTRQGQVKLADFGLAKADDSIMVTQTGAIVGSPAYMSPEAARGEEPEHHGDCYSLACSLFHLLCGQPPYLSNSALNVLHQHANAPIPSIGDKGRPDLVELFDPFFQRALAKDPKDRFEDAHAMAQALRQITNRIPPKLFAGPGVSGTGGVGVDAGAATISSSNMATVATASPAEKARARAHRRSGPNARSGSHGRQRGGNRQLPLFIGLGAMGLLLVIGVVVMASSGGGNRVPPPDDPRQDPPAVAREEPTPAPPPTTPRDEVDRPSEPSGPTGREAPAPDAERDRVNREFGIARGHSVSGREADALAAFEALVIPDYQEFDVLRNQRVEILHDIAESSIEELALARAERALAATRLTDPGTRATHGPRQERLEAALLAAQRDALAAADRRLDEVEAAIAAGDAERARELLAAMDLPDHPRFDRLAAPPPEPAGAGRPGFPDAPPDDGTLAAPHVLADDEVVGQLVHPFEQDVPPAIPYELTALWRSGLDGSGRRQVLLLELPAPLGDDAGSLQVIVHGGDDDTEFRVTAPPGDEPIASATVEAGDWRVVTFDCAGHPPGTETLLLARDGVRPFHLARAVVAPGAADGSAMALTAGTLLPLATAGEGSVETLVETLARTVDDRWQPFTPRIISPLPGQGEAEARFERSLDQAVTAALVKAGRELDLTAARVRPEIRPTRTSSQYRRELEAAGEDAPALVVVVIESDGSPPSQVRNWAESAQDQLRRGSLPVLVLLPDGDELECSSSWQREVDEIREEAPWLPIIDLHRTRRMATDLDIASDDGETRAERYARGIEAGLHELITRIAIWRHLLEPEDQGGWGGGMGFP